MCLFVACSLTSLNYLRSTDDVRPNDQTDLIGSCTTIPQSDYVLPISEHKQSSTVDMEVLSPGVIGEYRTNEMIASKVSLPQSQHQDNSALQNFKVTGQCTTDGIFAITFVVPNGTLMFKLAIYSFI